LDSHLLILYFPSIDYSPPEIYTLSLHDALPILAWSESPGDAKNRRCRLQRRSHAFRLVKDRTKEWLLQRPDSLRESPVEAAVAVDRKSTRLNSSHVKISYAVFCLKKKNEDTFTF